MTLTLPRPPIAPARALALTVTPVAVREVLDEEVLAAPALPQAARPVLRGSDIVEEWGLQSFPASDPPSNW